MKIFAFLKKEKTDIDVVDRKLEKFETIFRGTHELSITVKSYIEGMKDQFVKLKEGVADLKNNGLYGMLIDEEKVASQVDSHECRIKRHSKLLMYAPGFMMILTFIPYPISRIALL